MSAGGTLLKRALDSLTDVVYVYDDAGQLVHWNQRLNDLFDLSDEELAGRTPMDFFVEGDRPAIEHAVVEIAETGETTVEARAETTEGMIQFELTGRALTDEEGTYLGFGGIGRDVTERRAQERQLNSQNERLTEFADILAHDLRNPLAVANGHLELARDDHDSEPLAAAANAQYRMAQIIDDVRSVADGIDVEDGPVSLAEIASAAWETVDTGDASLDVAVSRTVTGDAGQLLRLFENLFRNSVDHGPVSGDDTASLTVAVEQTVDGFAVVDDGQGIPAGNRSRLFEPGISFADGGTGFGLYIVHTVADAHGWTVEATDSESGGARFEFDLSNAA